MATKLKKSLQTLLKDMEKLSQRIEKLIAGADDAEKLKPMKAASKKDKKDQTATPAKRTVVKLRKKTPVKKAESRMSANMVVLDIIRSSDQAVEISTIKEKSGFQGQKLYNALYALKKQGKIDNPNKGFYEKASTDA